MNHILFEMNSPTLEPSDKGGYRYIDNSEMVNDIPIEGLSENPIPCFFTYHWEDRGDKIVVTDYKPPFLDGKVDEGNERFVDDSIRGIIEQDLRKKYHFSCNAVKFETNG